MFIPADIQTQNQNTAWQSPFPTGGILPGLGPSFNMGSQQAQEEIPRPKELDLPRAMNYYADYSGCGFWRMIWPEHLLNAHAKAVIHGTTVMSLDPRNYIHTKTVRVQRQATPHQFEFIKFLNELKEKIGFKLIYEIDDIVFREDIPDYNKYKTAFTSDEIRQAALDIMQSVDEITVTNDFMKQYYIDKTGNKNVTVIPNYPPRWWMGHFYNEKNIRNLYNINRKRPRVLYAGSGAHFDVENRVNQNDDFAHVRNVVAATRKMFKWVFLGAYPLPLHEFVVNGDIEYHPWSRLYDYPYKIASLNVNMIVAPLRDSIFNKAKSDLKYIEACCYGIPGVFQNIGTYKNAPHRFTSGDEMIDQLKKIWKDKSYYMKLSKSSRTVAEKRWLENEDNIDKYIELYTQPYGHPERKLLNKQNGLP